MIFSSTALASESLKKSKNVIDIIFSWSGFVLGEDIMAKGFDKICER